MMRMEAITAGVSVAGVSLASVLPETDQLEAMAKWPLVLILAAVAIICVYLMYRGNREGSKDRLEEAKMHLEEAKMHTESIDKLATAITNSHDRIIKEIADQKALLAQRPCIRDSRNN